MKIVRRTSQLLVLGIVMVGLAHLAAQTPATRYVGTLTAASGDMLTVKTDAGEVHQVQVPASAVLKRVAPGQRDLSSAVDITLADLATGDRVLVRLDPAANTPQALQVITIKQADVALKQQQEREAWQKSGVGGLVKSVDAAGGTIVIASGAGATGRAITIHISTTTVLKRYAPASVRFDLARPAPLGSIQPGDQLRARGEKSPDGASVNADEVISGSFLNLSGLIASLDPATSTFVLKDLQIKKQVSVRVSPDSQMHALPETMAQMLAARLKGAADTHGAPHTAPAGPPPEGANRTPNGNGDLQQMLNRAPSIQFTDLKKGQAVMVVATADSNNATAITVLTGVEPLLQAPEASSNLLSNWSMGSGGGDAAVQ